MNQGFERAVIERELRLPWPGRGPEAAAPMAECLVSMGIRLPDPKAKRGRRRKGKPE